MDQSMESTGLISICISAFFAVFIVLYLLAVIMRIIISIFPETETDEVTAYAVIASTMNTMYPGTQIKKIEEIK